MPMQDLNDSLEQENLHSSHNDASILDQDASASAPWMMDPLQSQDNIDLQSFPYSCNTDYGAMLREHDPNLPTSAMNYEVMPSLSYILSVPNCKATVSKTTISIVRFTSTQ